MKGSKRDRRRKKVNKEINGKGNSDKGTERKTDSLFFKMSTWSRERKKERGRLKDGRKRKKGRFE